LRKPSIGGSDATVKRLTKRAAQPFDDIRNPPKIPTNSNHTRLPVPQPNTIAETVVIQ
jgi:hypothetical protein